MGRVLEAGLWAAALSGAPSTLHALATGRDPLEATLAAGSLLLPQETRRSRLVAAAGPVHLGISLVWALVLERAHVRGATRGALAGAGIAAIGLGTGRALSPRFRSLPLLPQIADHVVYGAIAGAVLDRSDD
jgi:drug/metabolite transporter superfamily protein YnfA